MGDERAEWWRGAALYQIYPLSFADSNGDGWGDLRGVTEHLDHVASLGVDGIWMSPFYGSRWVDFGYDTTNQKQVDPRCGTLEDFDAMLARAHALGLKVIVDQVYTYTSDHHPWFRSSRADPGGPHGDWYEWAPARPDGTPPSNWLSIFGGAAWSWDMRRRRYYMTHFLPEMPHLRVQSQAVQDALLDIGRFWLDRGVDGFRLDVINLAMVDPEHRDNPPSGENDLFIPADGQHSVYDISRPENLDFVRRIRRLADEEPGRFLLGEVAGRAPMADAREYTSPPELLHSAYFLLGAEQRPLTASMLRAELSAWDANHAGWPTWAFGNHDCMRATTRCGERNTDASLARLLVAVLVSARGTMLLYQGEELGLPDGDVPFDSMRDPASRRFYPEFLQRDGARTPMPWRADAPAAGFTTGVPWLPLPAAHATLAVDAQSRDPDSTLAWTRRVLQLRRAEAALRTGDVQYLDTPEPLLAFERTLAGRRLTCAFNLSATDVAVGLELTGARMLLGHRAELAGGRLVLGPHGICIAALEPG